MLKADPKYGGTVYSLTPDADWNEIVGEGRNPNLMSDEKYKELVKAHVMFKVRSSVTCSVPPDFVYFVVLLAPQGTVRAAMVDIDDYRHMCVPVRASR